MAAGARLRIYKLGHQCVSIYGLSLCRPAIPQNAHERIRRRCNNPVAAPNDPQALYRARPAQRARRYVLRMSSLEIGRRDNRDT